MEQEEFRGRWMRNYYKAYKPWPSGELPLDEASHHIAHGIAQHHGGLKEEHMPHVRRTILEAIRPEDFKKSAIDIAAEVLNDGGLVIPWTVGDPHMQRLKIERGQFRDRVSKQVIDPETMNTNYTEYICASHKLEELPNIFLRSLQQGVTDVYVVDDNQETINIVHEISTLISNWKSKQIFQEESSLPVVANPYAVEIFLKFVNAWKAENEKLSPEMRKDSPNLDVHNFHVKQDKLNDPLGSFDAFVAKMREIMKENRERQLHKRFALVVDVDETMMHTENQLLRAADAYYSKLTT